MARTFKTVSTYEHLCCTRLAELREKQQSLAMCSAGNKVILRTAVLTLAVVATACTGVPWNDPYPEADETKSILYDSFSERPEHLDPVRSYSADEYTFIAQIYEPPLQYHFLLRPYELVPLTAVELPRPAYLGAGGKRLPEDAAADDVAYSVYRIQIQPGILYQPHPALAKSDSGEYLYHRLRPGDLRHIHTLSDFPRTGTRELTAADYIYQIKRLVHPTLHSPIAGLMKEYIVGLAELGAALSRGRDQPAYLDLQQFPLDGVKHVDRYTYEITIRGKYPQFIYWLAMPFFAPMPWEADAFYSQPGMTEENITLNWYPLGTGPYMLAENNPNRRMVLEKNPNFRGEAYPDIGEPEDQGNGLLRDAGEPMPFIDEAIYSVEKESIPYWNKFLQGYYDRSGVVSDSFDQAVQFDAYGEAQLTETMEKRGIELQTAVTTSIYYMGFNMLDDVVGGDSERARKLRQAISIAVDYEEYISIFTNGRGIPAQGPIPPGIFGNREGKGGVNPYVYDWVNGQPQRKPIELARRLMVEAGYPRGRHRLTGKPLVLYFDTSAAGPDSKAQLDWSRKQFAKLGVQLVVRATDYNRFQDKMRKGSAQIFQWGWNADYPDPENFLFLLYGAHSKVTHEGENAANYSNPQFDRWFEKMKNMDNTPERQVIIDHMVDIARRDAPWLWGWHPVAFSLHHGWYKNAKPNLMANNTLKYKRVDPFDRAAKRKAWNRPVLWPVMLLASVFAISIIPAIVSYKRKERSAAL